MRIVPFYQSHSALSSLVHYALIKEFLDDIEITEPFLLHEVYLENGPQRDRLLKENPDLCLVFLDDSNEATRCQAESLHDILKKLLPNRPILWATADKLSKEFDFTRQFPRSQLIDIRWPKNHVAENPWRVLIDTIRLLKSMRKIK